MPFVTVSDIRLHYVERGAGHPLLLVHGFPLDHSMWSEQLAGLSDRYRVIAPDLRGSGQSAVTVGTVSMEQYADDLAAFLDALAIATPITFCGLSMGGYIAWQFWKRHPQRLAALILCDTKAAADTAEAARGRLETADKVLAQGPQVLADSLLEKLFAKETVQANPAIVESTRKVMLATSPVGIAAALRGMAQRPDMTGILPQIRVPTLLLGGEHDVISKPEEMRGIAAAIPLARFVEIPRAGHMSPLEQPRLVNDAILGLDVGTPR